MKTKLIILIGLLLLTACSREDKAVVELLDRADSLLRVNPDSALKLLSPLSHSPSLSSPPLGEVGRGFGMELRMRYWLLKADALNKTDAPLPSDTLMKEVVEYYDRHGNANERMRAHYLLGRVYHDMGEAPQALECYQQAAEQADTTSADCDLYNLYAVYGQMADLYHKQYLPEYESQAFRQCEQIAWKDRDTLSALKAIELQISPSYLQGDTDKVLQLTHEVSNLYLQYGYKEYAAATYPVAIYIHIVRGEIHEAKRLMDIFETESGLFDKNGNIISGREHYYYSRGMYHMKQNQLDKAEDYFRRLSLSGDEDGARGILMISRLRANNDSVVKYSFLYEEALDSLHKKTKIEAIANTKALYSYERNRRLAQEKEEKLRNNRIIFISSIIGLLLLITFVIFTFRAKNARRTRTIISLREQLNQIEEERDFASEQLRINMKQQELFLTRLKKDHDANIMLLRESLLKEYKEQEVILRKETERLSDRVNELHHQLDEYKIKDIREALEQDSTVKYFRGLVKPRNNLKDPSPSDWVKLRKAYMQINPLDRGLYGELTKQEQKVFLLFGFDFIEKEVAGILKVSKQRVSYMKKEIQKKKSESQTN